MLARSNRITRGSDYQRVVRRGKRVGARGLVISVEPAVTAHTPTRFGFIITKRVGVAVVRNRLRRQLKAICRTQLALVPEGVDVVIRVHPEAADLSFDELVERVNFGISTALPQLRRPVSADAT